MNPNKYSTNLREVLDMRIKALAELMTEKPFDPEEIPQFRVLDKQSKQIVAKIYLEQCGDDLRNEAEGIDINYE